jgi:lysozyme family protein
VIDTKFKKAFQEVLNFEGGYSDDPDDRGGKTKYGITETTARRLGYKGNMRDLTLDQAKKLYYDHYWKNLNYDKIEDERIAVEMFDQAVNMGPGNANRNLQKAYNLLNRGKAEDLKVDGIIGPITLTYVNRYPYQGDLLQLLNVLQAKHYIAIIENDPSQEKFFRGWLQRTKVNWRKIS